MKIIYSIFVILILITFSNCKESDPIPNKVKNVKYEITGNFSGKLLIIYTDISGGNKTLFNVSVPWSQEVTYPESVAAIGIGGQAEVTGNVGQTVVVKIFVDGVEVKSSPASAGSLGELVLPSIAYSF